MALVLLAQQMGSENYRTRIEAQKKLAAMPWAEPAVCSQMYANPELLRRSQLMIAYWHRPVPPRPGERYILHTENQLSGWIGNVWDDYVLFLWHDDELNVTRHMQVNWRLNRLEKVKK